VLTRALRLSPPERKISPKESPSSFLQLIPRILRLPTAKFKSTKSKFDTEADLESFAGCFDKGLKTAFSDDSKPKFVKFGSARDNDSRCDVKGGQLTLQG